MVNKRLRSVSYCRIYAVTLFRNIKKTGLLFQPKPSPVLKYVPPSASNTTVFRGLKGLKNVARFFRFLYNRFKNISIRNKNTIIVHVLKRSINFLTSYNLHIT